MKVKALIEALSKHDPETLVVLEHAPYGTHEGYNPVDKLDNLTISEVTPHFKGYRDGKFAAVEGWEENPPDKQQEAIVLW